MPRRNRNATGAEKARATLTRLINGWSDKKGSGKKSHQRQQLGRAKQIRARQGRIPRSMALLCQNL